MDFSDALGGIGTVLDTPRRLLYQGGTALARAGGYEGPDINHFADLLGQAGMDQDSWLTKGLGFAGDVATDPLTYLGGLGGLKGARALRGTIPSYVAQEGKAGAFAADSLAGASKFKAPLQDVKVAKNMEWLEPGVMPAMPEAGGKVVTTMPTGEGRLSAEFTRTNGQTPTQLRAGLHDMTQNGVGADFVNNTGGFYDAQTKTMASAAGEDAARNLRHERVHAIVDQASQGQGKMGDLPYLIQAPARLKASSKPLLQDAGVMMDELAAQTLENRSLGGQMKGAMSYLFHPEKNATYTGMYKAGGLDPRLISAYSSLPGAMAGSGAVAGAGAPAFARMLGGD
jgi:hypothetical protein